MKLSAIKSELASMDELSFTLPDGTQVPAHFHVTEVGQVSKRYIDCGGTIRQESAINFQLWEDGDVDHRLAASKLMDIIALAGKACLGRPRSGCGIPRRDARSLWARSACWGFSVGSKADRLLGKRQMWNPYRKAKNKTFHRSWRRHLHSQLWLLLIPNHWPMPALFYPALANTIANLPFAAISSERIQLLDEMATYLRAKMKQREEIRLNFICTHNSRRSQFSQIWAQTAAAYHGIDANCYSGGIEVTAFNPGLWQPYSGMDLRW